MWWYTDKHVDVIFTRLCFQSFYLFLIAQFSQYFADIFFLFHHILPVFDILVQIQYGIGNGTLNVPCFLFRSFPSLIKPPLFW